MRAAAEQRETDGLWFGRQTHRRQDGISAPRRDREARRSQAGTCSASRVSAGPPVRVSAGPRVRQPASSTPRNTAASALAPLSAPKTARPAVLRARTCIAAVTPETATTASLMIKVVR